MKPAILIAFALLVVASPAHAGTITFVSEQGGKFGGNTYYTFTAAPGERNELTFKYVEGKGVRVTDTGAPLSGCPADGPDAVLCPGTAGFIVDVGDGDDTVIDAGTTYAIRGGAGNDHLVGGSYTSSLDGGEGDDVLEGGAGVDQLSGGPGADRITGGAGNDSLGDADLDVDAIDGGEGIDSMFYIGFPAGVSVDLRTGLGADGGPLTGIEQLTGSAFDDVLTGTDRPDELDGSGGRDRVEGLGGNDRLAGGTGDDELIGGDGDDYLTDAQADVYDGGAGDDELNTDGAGNPLIHCGPGQDEVTAQFQTGVPRLDACEVFLGTGPEVRVRGSRLFLAWRKGHNWATPCRLRVTIAGRRFRVLRRFDPATLRVRAPARVTIRPSTRCRGLFGRGSNRTAFEVLT